MGNLFLIPFSYTAQAHRAEIDCSNNYEHFQVDCDRQKS